MIAEYSDTPLAVRLPIQTLEWIDDLAARRGLSRSQIAREILVQGIPDHPSDKQEDRRN